MSAREVIFTVIVVVALGGCGEESPAMEATEPAGGTTVGLTEDGTQVVFAGARTEPSTPAPPSQNSNFIAVPNAPDPEAGEFTLEEAVVGLPLDGGLVVEFGTTFGTIFCDLDAEAAPNAVANFVGLARGLRPFWDGRAGLWVTRPYYRGLTFHRVIPEFLIQGGDHLGDGTGQVGYTIADENTDESSHDSAGQLCMASQDGADSAGAQFFITDGPARQLDAGGGSTIFGQCRPAATISQIARVPQDADNGHRPRTEVRLTRVLIRRVAGGAAQATPTLPQLPPGEPEEARGASAGPSEMRSRDGRRLPSPSPFPNGRRGPPSPPRPHQR